MLIYQDIFVFLRLRYFCVLTQRKRQIATVSISYGLHKSYKTDVVSS